MKGGAAGSDGQIGRFGSNSLILLASQGLNTVLAGLFGIVLVRYLGREQYGLLTTVYAYLFVFQIFSSLGMDTIVYRDVARAPEDADEILARALGVRLLLAVTSMVAGWLLIGVIDPTPQVVRLQFLASLTLPFSLYPFYLVLYSVDLRMGLPKLVLGAWGIVVVCAKVGLIVLRQPIEAFVIADVASAVVVLLLSRNLGRRSGLRVSFRFAPEHWKELLRVSWPVAAAMTFINIYLRVDQLMLYRMVGAAEVGLYGATVRVVEFGNVIPVVFMGSAFPILARLWRESTERLDRATELSFRAMLWAGLPLAAVLQLYAAPILDLLFGNDFVAAAPIMRLLAWSVPAAFLGSVLHNRLFSASQQMAAAWLALLAASMNVGLNLWLIPRYQGVGAAAATLISYAMVPLFALGSAQTRALGVTALRCIIRPGLVVLGGMAMVWFLDPGPVVGVALLLAVYVTGLVVTREWGPPELALVRRALRGR